MDVHSPGCSGVLLPPNKKGLSYRITLPCIPEGIVGFLMGLALVVTLVCSDQLEGILKTALCLGFR